MKDKIAVITGGSSGIGLAVAMELEAEGASVVIFGRNRATLDEARARLGPNAMSVQGDVTSMADLDRLYRSTAERFGRIDVLVANAGSAAPPVPFDQVTEAQLDAAVAVNFKGVFFTIQKALPLFRGGGSIVVTTSIAGQMALPTTSVYAASKAATQSLVQSLGVALVSHGIRINAVSPGPTATPLLERGRVRSLSEIESRVPIKRVGTAAEIAKVVAFLASEDASYVVGEEVVVDGGMSLL